MSRTHIASQAEEVIAGRVKVEDFVMSIPEDLANQDELIGQLIDFLEHEPKIGGFLGVSVEDHQKYMRNVQDLIQVLKGA
jgi:hypothetical protein